MAVATLLSSLSVRDFCLNGYIIEMDIYSYVTTLDDISVDLVAGFSI
jgi:hypothetical protein